MTHLRAIGFALLGFAVWVVSDSFVKVVSEAGVPSYEIVALIGFFGSVFMVLKVLPKRALHSLWPNSPKKQAIRSALAFTCGIFNAIALRHLSMAFFYIVVFTAPMMISVLAAVFLREHMKWPKALAILIGFGGVIVAIDPFRQLNHGDLVGYAAAFGSAACFACSVTWLRVITQTESADSLVFFVALVEAIGGLVMMIGGYAPLTPKFILLLACAGLTGILGNFAVYKAIRHTAAATVSQFHYTQIVTGALIGYLVWNDVPTLNMLAGIMIIILSGIYVAAHARRMENRASAIEPSH